MAHLGIYHDAYVPRLRRFTDAIHGGGAHILLRLEAAGQNAERTEQELARFTDLFVASAWRAYAAGFDGVMLSAADGGLLHELTSPLTNTRTDTYGGNSFNRLRLSLEIIEGIRRWLGPGFLIGFRMIAEEFAPRGVTMQDARVTAGRLVSAGVHLLDITSDLRSEIPIARFPGWQVPLANSIKRVIPDIPVMSSGLLGDPHLADSVIRDGSIDLVMLGKALHTNPYWPQIAQIVLSSNNDQSAFAMV